MGERLVEPTEPGGRVWESGTCGRRVLEYLQWAQWEVTKSKR